MLNKVNKLRVGRLFGDKIYGTVYNKLNASPRIKLNKHETSITSYQRVHVSKLISLSTSLYIEVNHVPCSNKISLSIVFQFSFIV